MGTPRATSMSSSCDLPTSARTTRAWAASVEEWRQTLATATGNRIEILEVGHADMGISLGTDQPLWRDVVHDGRVVFGSDFGTLRRATNG